MRHVVVVVAVLRQVGGAVAHDLRSGVPAGLRLHRAPLDMMSWTEALRMDRVMVAVVAVLVVEMIMVIHLTGGFPQSSAAPVGRTLAVEIAPLFSILIRVDGAIILVGFELGVRASFAVDLLELVGLGSLLHIRGAVILLCVVVAAERPPLALIINPAQNEQQQQEEGSAYSPTHNRA